MFYQHALINQLFDRTFHRSLSNSRTELHDITLSKFSNSAIHSTLYHLYCREFFADEIYSVLKVPICRKDRSQQIFNERCRIFLVLIPATLTGFKRIVIQIFIFSVLAPKL
ncbi:hypothetical protein HNP82_000969 [Catenibacillus scindens]|uniref:Uncharacterized protein n=1 Tax=Catenibacillus scindens TaxID=673271 RepID=A0A7W8H8K2_9FIRM|nr:hypothetical protein [Catenibacillus scindens]